MKKINGPESNQTIILVKMLEHQAVAQNAPIWKKVAELVKIPKRKKATVNLTKISKLAKEGQTVVVPSRLLSVGLAPEFALTLAVQSSSVQTKQKLAGKKVKLISIAQLVEMNPKGSNVRIIV